MKHLSLSLVLVSLFTAFLACKKETKPVVSEPSKTIIQERIYVFNKGKDHGDISSSEDSLGKAFFNDCFSKANNGESIGSKIMSAAIVNAAYDPKIYVVCQNPDRIVILNAKTLKKITEINQNDEDSLVRPEHIYAHKDFAYVTCSDSRKSCVIKIDADKNSVKKVIPVAGGANRIERSDVNLFVTLKEKPGVAIIHMHLDEVLRVINMETIVNREKRSFMALDLISTSTNKVLISAYDKNNMKNQGYFTYDPALDTIEGSLNGGMDDFEVGTVGLFTGSGDRSSIWICGKNTVKNISTGAYSFFNNISDIEFDDYRKQLIVLSELDPLNFNNGKASIVKNDAVTNTSLVGIHPVSTVFFHYKETK